VMAAALVIRAEPKSTKINQGFVIL
jgi:hypothetical protein